MVEPLFGKRCQCGKVRRIEGGEEYERMAVKDTPVMVRSVLCLWIVAWRNRGFAMTVVVFTWCITSETDGIVTNYPFSDIDVTFLLLRNLGSGFLNSRDGCLKNILPVQ